MKLGIDFDNTIVSYDALFHAVAAEKNLIPSSIPKTKNGVRDYLRQRDREDDWTELQGYVYGLRMNEAEPFPGVKDFFLRCKSRNIPVYIISHKTKYPYRGPQYNLHKAALGWLHFHGFFESNCIALSMDNVFFEESKDLKLKRIMLQKCTHFIDDLPEFLTDPDFPADVIKVLFDTQNQHESIASLQRAQSWNDMCNLLHKVF